MSSTNKQAATVTSPAVSTTSATVLAAGMGRSMWVVSNPTAGILYLRFGSTAASSTDFTVAVPAGTATSPGYYECPIPVYGGQVTGILSTGSGNVQVTSW